MIYYVGLDIGGTNGRMKISDEKGLILGEFQSPGCSINTDGYEKSRERFRQMILPYLTELELMPEECMGICGAISGVDSPSDANACRRIFEEMGFRKQYLKIVNDCEIFLYLSNNPALVVISGTGSICFGRDSANNIYRTGGWNHIVSDEGSGFDLGLHFLQAVADDLDGRKHAPLLTSMMVQESGLDTLEKINLYINENLFEKSQIAKFAQLGYEAATKGDSVAEKIHEDCANKLFALIYDTYQKMNICAEEVDLWLWGSVLVKNELIRFHLENRLASQLPFLKLLVPTVSALDTALQVAFSLKNS